MAIKELITLEGSEEVKKQLADLGKSGEDFIASVNNLGTSQNPQLQQVFETIKKGTAANVEHGKSVSQLTTLYHLLHPALTQAGLGMSEFRGFAVAAHLGVAGLAGAVGATLALSLANLSEGSSRARERLNELFQTSTLGKNAFDNLSAAAGNSGTTVSKLLPIFEGFTKALDTFFAKNKTFKFVALSPEDLPSAASLQDRAKELQSFFQILRGGGASEADATKAIQEFNAEVAKTGVVTGQMVDKLLNAAPGALKNLDEIFGKGSISAADLIRELDLTPEKLDKFAQGLLKIVPNAQKAFDSKPIGTFTDNVKESLSTLERSVGSFGDKATESGKTAQTEIAGVFSELVADGTTTYGQLVEIFSTNPIDFENWKTPSIGFFDGLVSLAQSTWDRMQSIFSRPIQPNIGGSGGSTGPGGSPFASGGLISGPGSTTSDSILAWLSNREFVINAKAVDHYGPSFFAALNAMRLPKDFGFSMGGLVRSMIGPMPKMAAGGMAMAGTPVNITIGQNTFRLSAPEETAKKLKQYSISSQLSSSGRKPSWVR